MTNMKDIFEKLKYRRVNISLRSGGLITGTVFAFKDNLLVLATVERKEFSQTTGESTNSSGIDFEFEFVPQGEIIGFSIESKWRVKNVGDEAFEKTVLEEREESTLYPFRHEGWLKYEHAIREKLDLRLKDLGIII